MTHIEPTPTDLKAALAEAQRRISDLEAALAAQQMAPPDLLRTVFDQLPIGIDVRDRQGRFLLVNRAVLSMLGADRLEQVIGHMPADLLPTEIAARWGAVDQAVIETGQPVRREAEAVTHPATGETAYFEFTRVPLFDDGGQLAAIAGLVRDVTWMRASVRHKVDVALAQERAAMLRSFIDDASHDLRTPLMTMSLSLAILQRDVDEATHKRHREILQTQMTHLQQLLDDLLSASRLDRRMTIELSYVDVGVLLGSILQDLGDLAARKHHAVQLVNDAGGSIQVLADETHLRRALLAIVTNALNYTPDGGTITVRITPLPGQVAITVTDTGIGISRDDQAHIFERFYRADHARNTERGGLGLGLAIAREVVEVHGGRIEVESEPGRGSTFTVRLPRVDETA